jgi:hypothetical protein
MPCYPFKTDWPTNAEMLEEMRKAGEKVPTCDICELNPEGKMSYLHCLNSEVGKGCKGCKHRCGRKAYYIGGMNICGEKHFKALQNRVLYPTDKGIKANAEEIVAQSLQEIEETFKHL